MKNTYALLLMLILSITGFTQSPDNILQKHFEAKGVDRLTEYNSMILQGKSLQQGQETQFKLYVEKPGKMRLEVDLQGQTFIQAYNGKIGWTVMPWTGSTEPSELKGPQLYGIQLMSDLEGPLYNWKEKGYRLEFLGEEEVEGETTYKLRLIINNNMKIDYFINKENYLVDKEVYHLSYQGQEVEQVNYYDDYREVEGTMVSFQQKTGTGDQIIRSSEVIDVTYDQEIDDDMFEMTAN